MFSNDISSLGIAENFSEWSFKLKIEDVPTAVLNKIKLIFIDSFGLIYASRNEEYIKTLKKFFYRLWKFYYSRT